MRDTNLSRTTTQRALATPHTSPAGEKTGQMAQAFKRAAADHAHIAQRAYELYEQRGRQDGLDLEDWLKAERELGEQCITRDADHEGRARQLPSLKE